MSSPESHHTSEPLPLQGVSGYPPHEWLQPKPGGPTHDVLKDTEYNDSLAQSFNQLGPDIDSPAGASADPFGNPYGVLPAEQGTATAFTPEASADVPKSKVHKLGKKLVDYVMKVTGDQAPEFGAFEQTALGEAPVMAPSSNAHNLSKSPIDYSTGASEHTSKTQQKKLQPKKSNINYGHMEPEDDKTLKLKKSPIDYSAIGTEPVINTPADDPFKVGFANTHPSHDIGSVVADINKVEPTPWYVTTESAEGPKIPTMPEAAANANLTDAEVLERMKNNNYAKAAPRFAEILDDESRTNTFRYVDTDRKLYNRDPKSHDTVTELTEHDGLNKLHSFLTDYLQTKIKQGEGDDGFARKAKGILENLTFIGDKEYKEATKGLGVLWRAYLDEDPLNQLCVPTEISRQGGKRKSDVHLFENILASFTDEELEQYGGRIVTSLNDIERAPKNVRVILLDDWTISGSQMRDAYTNINERPNFAPYASQVEINLVVSSANRLQNGLKVQTSWSKPEKSIPVKAYYKAHDAHGTSVKEHKAHVTGTHSSVDFDYEETIYDITQDMNRLSYDSPHNMPPLTNIVRTYRYAEPLISVHPNGRIVRNNTSNH